MRIALACGSFTSAGAARSRRHPTRDRGQFLTEPRRDHGGKVRVIPSSDARRRSATMHGRRHEACSTLERSAATPHGSAHHQPRRRGEVCRSRTFLDDTRRAWRDRSRRDFSRRVGAFPLRVSSWIRRSAGTLERASKCVWFGCKNRREHNERNCHT